MVKEQKKPKEPAQWDRRPWPENGDDNVEILYYSVGLFLSQWERFEAALAVLFGAFVASSSKNPHIARRAYTAVRTFEGRAEMLRAASTAFFEVEEDDVLREDFKKVLIAAINFSQRRNDIAHGVAGYFFKPENHRIQPTDKSVALFPSQASYRERTTADLPSYCMISSQIVYFFECVCRLQSPTLDVALRITKRVKPRPSLRRLYEPALQSPNLKADHNLETKS